MSTPEQPKNPPGEGAPPDHDPDGRSPRGIPAGAENADAKGTPTSDRQATETAAS